MADNSKQLVYDVFCGAGGATKGYKQLGLVVIGIDNKPQPRYCGDGFILMDALEFLGRYISGGYREALFFHASPPCQAYSESAKQWRIGGRVYSDMIGDIRELLKKTGRPYIIENVRNAPLVDPFMLNGAKFGLKVARKRYFETSFEIPFELMPPDKPAVRMGRPVREGDVIQPVGHFSGVEYAKRQMGIDWMVQSELAQAIPPAYTEYIGSKCLYHLGKNGTQNFL